MSYIQKHITVHPPSGCWFWDESTKLRRSNAFGHALIKVHVPSIRTRDGRNYAEYNVTRLLCDQLHGELPKHTRIVDPTCGLSQCVNPSHWKVLVPPLPWQLDVYSDKTWQLTNPKTGRPCGSSELVNIKSAGIIHVAHIHPLFHRTNDTSFRMMCDAVIDPATAVVVDNTLTVTCKGGC